MDKDEGVVLDFSIGLQPPDIMEDAELLNRNLGEFHSLEDPERWKKLIKEAAMKILGASEEEANLLVEREAPDDLLEDWLTGDQEEIFDGEDENAL